MICVISCRETQNRKLSKTCLLTFISRKLNRMVTHSNLPLSFPEVSNFHSTSVHFWVFQYHAKQFLFLQGTGKTRTLVASIEEIVRSKNDSYILVCANSDTACDEITERLLNVLKENEIFRMYSKTHNIAKVSKSIAPICNHKDGRFQFPSLEYLYKYRVLVSTVWTAGSLTRASVVDSKFKSDHFSHVMIDECASTHTTMSLIAIADMFIQFQFSLLRIFYQFFWIVSLLHKYHSKQAYALICLQSIAALCWLAIQCSWMQWHSRNTLRN